MWYITIPTMFYGFLISFTLAFAQILIIVVQIGIYIKNNRFKRLLFKNELTTSSTPTFFFQIFHSQN